MRVKGLEFDEVFLIDFNEDVIPGMTKQKAKEDNKMEEFEESRRLAYVGITRAKKKLHIITSNSRPNCFVVEACKARGSINSISGYLRGKKQR